MDFPSIIYILCYDQPTYDHSVANFSRYKWARPVILENQSWLFENVFWNQLMSHHDEWKDAEYVGVLSHKFYKKIDLRRVIRIVEEFSRGIRKEKYFYFHQKLEMVLDPNSLAMKKHPNFGQLWTYMLNELDLDDTNESLCNYFICTPPLMERFIHWFSEMCLPILKNHHLCFANSGYKGSLSDQQLINLCGMDYYPLGVFVLERISKCFFDKCNRLCLLKQSQDISKNQEKPVELGIDEPEASEKGLEERNNEQKGNKEQDRKQNQNTVSCVILNYKRPENVHKIVADLKQQTVVPKIVVWNNNCETSDKFEVDIQINSSENFGCMARWFIMSQLDTDYVFSIDDDISITNDSVVKYCMETLIKLKEDGYKFPIICRSGRGVGKLYKSRLRSVNDQYKVGLGLFLFMERSFLERVNFMREREDDIFISSFSDFIYCSNELNKYILDTDLTCDENANHKQAGHSESRQRAYDKFILKL